MMMRRLALGVMLLCSCQVALALEKQYRLPERGFVKMEVPAGWRDQLRQPPQSLPPTILFRAGQGQPFEILLTPIWPARADVAPSSKDSIRRQVERAADGVKGQTLEQDIALVEFAGAAGPGYYFSVTDRAPKPGEYKFMTQGIVKVSGLVVTFTILSNDGQGQVAREALSMIRSAVHVGP
jgi:hypothetical protein